MLIGAMNNPCRDVVGEIGRVASLGFEFIDLTLEPPLAMSSRVCPEKIRVALERHNIGVVGHTAHYLPIASAFKDIRLAALRELRDCMAIFRRLGASSMTVHPDSSAPMHDGSFLIERNIQSIRDFLPAALEEDMVLVVENPPGFFSKPEHLGSLLDALPEVKLNLDFGHANLGVPLNVAESILTRYGSRLQHVHVHDNVGRDDLHLPLGAGTLDIASMISTLKKCGYDSTITLEVFAPDSRHLAYSRDVLRAMWNKKTCKPGD